jgi:hypothetical protein
MRRYLFEALVLSVTDITVHSLKPTFLPAAWSLILVVITTEILWLPRIRHKFAQFGIKGGRRMWWSYPTVALVGAVWLCGYWLAAQGAFSFITSSGHAASIHSESSQQQEQTSEKKKDGEKKDVATTDAGKKNDTHKGPPKAPVSHPNASPPVPAQQPTYSVTNPTDSIVNQNSPNYGTQTVVANPEWRIDQATKVALIPFLSKAPKKAILFIFGGDTSTKYANDFRDVGAPRGNDWSFGMSSWKANSERKTDLR